jgi:hypothetical protein
MAGNTWKIAITKENDVWTVETPKGKVNRETDSVEWTLCRARNGSQDGVSAHFQFAQGDVFESTTNAAGNGFISKDWTAEILTSPAEKLVLKVQPGADRRNNPRHYAVWIRDESLKNGRGGVFAVGEDGNPPPEMQVGP